MRYRIRGPVQTSFLSAPGHLVSPYYYRGRLGLSIIKSNQTRAVQSAQTFGRSK